MLLPQSSVHRKLTAGDDKASCFPSSPLSSAGVPKDLVIHSGGPGYNALLWLSLLHSSHFNVALQVRARCVDDDQHLKQIPCSLK